MAHQEVINSIIGETKSAIEDTEGPFYEFIQEYFSHERPTIDGPDVLVQKINVSTLKIIPMFDHT